MTKAHEIYEANPVPLYVAADWYIEVGDTENARRHYEKAVTISPAEGAAHKGFDEYYTEYVATNGTLARSRRAGLSRRNGAR